MDSPNLEDGEIREEYSNSSKTPYQGGNKSSSSLRKNNNRHNKPKAKRKYTGMKHQAPLTGGKNYADPLHSYYSTPAGAGTNRNSKSHMASFNNRSQKDKNSNYN